MMSHPGSQIHLLDLTRVGERNLSGLKFRIFLPKTALKPFNPPPFWRNNRLKISATPYTLLGKNDNDP